MESRKKVMKHLGLRYAYVNVTTYVTAGQLEMRPRGQNILNEHTLAGCQTPATQNANFYSSLKLAVRKKCFCGAVLSSLKHGLLV